MMRMQSETIAEGSEPSSMGSLAEAGGCANNIDEADNSAAIDRSNHGATAASDVFLEDFDVQSDEKRLEQVACLENWLDVLVVLTN